MHHGVHGRDPSLSRHPVTRVIDELADLLPAQGPISIFIHHNTLHAFEHLSFEEAVETAGESLGREPFLAESRYRDKLASRFKWLNGELAEKPFLMGEHFSVADAYLFAVTRWAKPQGIDLTALPHVQAHHERVTARPAVQEALKVEGLLNK